ncbi:WD40-repeat-containing domain protein [Apiospora arundinis]|uniref:WD40-repeat-containing domain protein n=1 Tax=Apiospora arundinis TaxID=335852 RepID=A0ABR2HZN5_9PEZI
MAFPDKPIAHLLGSNGPVNAVSYSASPGTYILTGSSDRTIRLYNPASSSNTSTSSSSSYITGKATAPTPELPQGRLIQTYAAHGYEVLSLRVSHDNARFVSGGGDRSVFLWDVSTAQTLRRFGGNGASHSARINAVCFGGDDDALVVSGSLDATVRVWDTRNNSSFKPVQTLADAKDAVTSVVVVRDSAEIVAGSVDGRVRSYDVRMGRCLTDVVSPGHGVTSLCATRDGKALLVGSLDSKVRLMDRESGGCLKTYADPALRNAELRVQSILGGKEQYVLAGDEMTGSGTGTGTEAGTATTNPGGQKNGEGRVWAWDVMTGKVKAKIRVPWGPTGSEPRKKLIGKDGKEKERSNIISCLAWREEGFGDQYCVGGTSGTVTVFGYH